MECNRDEANRAKEIAERKFSAKDIRGAKKFALKAQALYPELDGISQLVATFDIYIAAENKINRESDFYAILGVNPSADDETVRKSYRKLALSLHPDKNKSVGADGAFKYISEAWGQLSDKSKRSAYDDRRNAAQNGGTPGQNGFYNFTKTTTTRNKGTSTTPKDRGTTSTAPPTSTNQKTFWTVCHACKMQYEYLRMYLHQNLLCPNCHEPFLAMETVAPNTKVSTKGFKSQKVKNASKSKGQAGGDSSFQWGPFSKTNNQASSAQAATMVQRAYEKVKREREEAQAAIKREEALRRKKKRAGNHFSSGHIASVKKTPGVNGVGNDDFWIVDETKGVLSIDSRTQLLERARYEIKKKLHQWSSGTVVNYQANTNEKEKLDDSVNVDLISTIEPLVMDVPDPDFHNFDRQRCETAFKEGQIWAAYDDDDGMPRHYAMIHKVSSVDPFKIKVCWLNSRTNDELDIFSEKAFGEFKLSKHENVTVPNIFSHKVNFTKSENGCYDIYPRKGDVWALYRNWSPEWNDETSNEVKHKYEIVEVDESNEDTGFTVTPLVKVAGFKTVFRRNLNPKEARVFPESEICRFSHQIPSHFLTGRGSLNAIKGCLDLDPAAIPDEFLQVIAVVQDLENIDDMMMTHCQEFGFDPVIKSHTFQRMSKRQFISINTRADGYL
ncbi:DnaJ domain-containing protein [Tanacetum coccineum]|uniref:DnaJ domain-containing protein n=1 Tax=Tanacetum coccineum TaxID=301880 RepID=A0ABQ5I168_9ASTR